ncbi:MAG: leucine-rich repeat protein [Prevotella sp.]|nr:leucine-rich repeat protein [Prevotella sp.]
MTSIGESAFEGCSGLTSITIPNGVTYIRERAFYFCTSLTSLTIPKSVTEIGSAAFEGCNLKTIVVENGNSVYDSREDCNAIIKTNENELYYGFVNSTIPNSVVSIRASAFQNCSGLTSIIIPSSVTSIGERAFKDCRDLVSITIPNSVTRIGSSAFRNCRSLTSVTIGSKVNYIGTRAFQDCKELTDVYCYAENVPKTQEPTFRGTTIENVTLHVPAASLGTYQATEPWKNFKEIVALPENDTDDSDYLPFVEESKQWHVVRSTSGPDHVYEVDFYLPSGIEEIYGNNYYKMKVNIKNTEFESYLLREEDRKIYIFDADRQEEYLMFDYSLKEGDTYETYSYEEQKMVTYKVLSVGDYTEGPQVKCYRNDEQANNGTTQYRYLRKWTVCRTDNEMLQKTWIEGVGSLEEPLANLYDERPISSVSYLAYVQYNENDYLYLPFTINDEFGQVHGCNLPKGKEDYFDWEDWHHQLSYELEGDRLHVYGKAILNCGLNYYACFIEEQTDDPLVRKLHFEMQGGGPSANCMGLYETDFYVSGFDPNINYIVVDNLEEEHPVINKTQQSNYIPFVEKNKQWHVVESYAYDDAYGNTSYGGSDSRFWMEEEVERDGKSYVHARRYLDALCEVQETGLFREENRRVYKYDEKAGRDIMLYDFSLKEGDTFTYEFGVDQPVNCKVLKQGLLEDGPQIASSCTLTPDGTLEIKYRWLNTWTIGRENESGEYEEFATWVEGVGALENVFGLISNSIGKFSYDLAYVERIDYETGYRQNGYLPFSFHTISMHGCNLQTGESNEEYDDRLHHLTYELEGDRLHIYGDMYIQCGPNNYAYFVEKPTDDPLMHMIEFIPREVYPVADCMGHHHTDFYVPGFDPNLNYYVLDDREDEKHPVINKMAYRPMIEDGKVWKVGSSSSGNPVKLVEYYYFDGDTIIDGKNCKQMMCQRYVSPDYPDYAVIMQYPLLQYVGAWYEEDKKVYTYDATNKLFKMMYDFSLDANDTLRIDNFPYVIGTRKTGGIKGFKGVYREVWECGDGENTYRCAPWLEGVGGVYGPPTTNVFNVELGDPAWFLMSCIVGDEVIYLNDEYEDEATPEGAKKGRFDFSHTIKEKPRAPMRREAEASEMKSLYGEYTERQLCINLNPLDDAYSVCITDESGNVVYEKSINTGNIVGLNIDISNYTEGRYTVTVENSQESFTGEFEVQTTGISLTPALSQREGAIYNLQGQRLRSLQKGLNIVNGRKFVVK